MCCSQVEIAQYRNNFETLLMNKWLLNFKAYTRENEANLVRPKMVQQMNINNLNRYIKVWQTGILI